MRGTVVKRLRRQAPTGIPERAYRSIQHARTYGSIQILMDLNCRRRFLKTLKQQYKKGVRYA